MGARLNPARRLAPLLLGVPALELGALSKVERAVGQPPVSWLLGVGTMLAWHIPALRRPPPLRQHRPDIAGSW